MQYPVAGPSLHSLACPARRRALQLTLAAAAAAGPWARVAAAAGTAAEDAVRGLAVLYPEIGEPYRSVFAGIMAGIDERAHARVPGLAVGPAASPQELQAELRRREVRAVIALGRNGLRVAAQLDRSVGVVAGGVLSVPESEAERAQVVSLAPDPGLLFTRIRSLLPAARRVIVAHDPRHNAWLMRLAREAARAQGLELVAAEAGDLRGALRAYEEWLGTMQPRRDVLWLPQDPTTVDDSTVLPLVLREAWNQNLAVVSSNAAHVRRGALMALYPDNAGLGRTLAAGAIDFLGHGPPPRGLQALKDVLMAMNTRTARHLGLDPEALPQRADLLFPER